jgi:hypothetical protein
VGGAEAVASQIAIQMIFYSGLAAPMVMLTFWRWNTSRLGWSITAKTIALSLALLPAMLVYWFGLSSLTNSDFLRWFTIVMLYLVPVIIWWRVYEVWRVQRRGGQHM